MLINDQVATAPCTDPNPRMILDFEVKLSNTGCLAPAAELVSLGLKDFAYPWQVVHNIPTAEGLARGALPRKT